MWSTYENIERPDKAWTRSWMQQHNTVSLGRGFRIIDYSWPKGRHSDIQEILTNKNRDGDTPFTKWQECIKYDIAHEKVKCFCPCTMKEISQCH